MLKYLNYDNLDMSEELFKIENSEEAEVVVDPHNKKCLFVLGMLFVNGVRIKIINEKEVREIVESEVEKSSNEIPKSFYIMSYIWSKMGNGSFPALDYSDVKTSMDGRVVNAKTIGAQLNKIVDCPTENKIFLICPVRRATPEQRKYFEDFAQEKTSEGYIIHAPHLNTWQKDIFGGYSICIQNAQAVASSAEIDMYYDQQSTGSVFDLGVAYALHKPLFLLNEGEITFNKDDMVDRMVENWPYNKKGCCRAKVKKD